MTNIDETRNCFIKEIDQNEFISNKHKKVYATLNYIEQFLILASAVTGSISISTFASLLGIPIGIKTGLKISTITAGIKKHKSIIRKNKLLVLLARTNLICTKVLIFKSLIDSYISHDNFVLVNNMLKNMMI